MGYTAATSKARWLAFALVPVGMLALGGCSQEHLDQWGRVGYPEAITDRAPWMGNLWVGTWIAAMVVGVFVWGLMAYVVVKFRRRADEDKPGQTQSNVPLELLYTVVPLFIISVLFFFTVQAQDAVQAKVATPTHTVNVVASKWSWTFNYMESANSKVGAVVHEAGTIETIPDLYLVINEPVRINLTSADVDHSFWVPQFYYKLDVLPGHPNSFDVTPTKEGVYLGKCAELCGTYHSNMLFNLHVVSQAEFDAKMSSLKAAGLTGEVKPPDFTSVVTVPTTEEAPK